MAKDSGRYKPDPFDPKYDDLDEWKFMHEYGKDRHRAHVKRNMEDYDKYIAIMIRMGFTDQVIGAGIRFTHASGLRIDFWKQSGKWTHVGTNRYEIGPRKMVKYAKAHTSSEGLIETQKGPAIQVFDETGPVTDETWIRFTEDDTPPWDI